MWHRVNGFAVVNIRTLRVRRGKNTISVTGEGGGANAKHAARERQASRENDVLLANDVISHATLEV